MSLVFLYSLENNKSLQAVRELLFTARKEEQLNDVSRFERVKMENTFEKKEVLTWKLI